MKPHHRFSVLVLIISLILSSCSKQNDPAPTKTQLLTQNTWTLTGVTYAGASIPGASFSGELQFKTDKTYSFSITGTVPGNAPISATETGMWALASDEKSFTMTPNGITPPTTITSILVKLDGTNLQYTQDVGGFVIGYTFVKK
jgi:hypothetical protein